MTQIESWNNKQIIVTNTQKQLQTWVLTAITLFSGIGESAPQGPLKDYSVWTYTGQSELKTEVQRNCWQPGAKL